MDIKPIRPLALALTLACSGAFAADATKPAEMTPAQKAMMDAYARMGEVRPEHKQLDYFVGHWTVKTTVAMDAAAPAEVSAGKSETNSVFGGRSLETHFEGSYSGQPFEGRGFLGFDNLKGKFFNTWMDSTTTGIFTALGSYDAASKSYTFRADMDDPVHLGKLIPIREVIRVVDAKHYVFEWYEPKDGKDARTMWIEYTRN